MRLEKIEPKIDQRKQIMLVIVLVILLVIAGWYTAVEKYNTWKEGEDVERLNLVQGGSIFISRDYGVDVENGGKDPGGIFNVFIKGFFLLTIGLLVARLVNSYTKNPKKRGKTRSKK